MKGPVSRARAWVLAVLGVAEIGFAQTDELATLAVEAPQIVEVALSPDGMRVAYSVVRGSVSSNQYATELWLQRIGPAAQVSNAYAGDELPVRLVRRVGETAGSFAPQWPGSSALTYLDEIAAAAGSRALIRYDANVGVAMPMGIVSVAPSVTGIRYLPCGPVSVRGSVGAVGSDYRWSRTGRYIAFTAAVRDGTYPDRRRGVSVSVQWRGPTSRSMLFVMDAASGRIEQCSPVSLHVLQFDWSPDDRELVLAATTDVEGVPGIRTDLFVMQRATGTVRPLVKRPGLDGSPSWSPDGKWIAFTTHHGVGTYYSGEPALVPAAGGEVVRLGTAEGPTLTPWAAMFWASDSRSFYFSSYHHMTHRLIRAGVVERTLQPVQADEAPYDDHFSVDADARTLAFTRQTPTQPPELLVQAFPHGKLRQVTQLSPAFPLADRVRVDTMRWSSADGLTVHGLLLTPRDAWRSGEHESGTVKRPLPTLVYLHGGPGMVRRHFMPDGRAGVLATLAASGYAVFVPNTRGRGGYGETFQRGMRDGGSTGELPYQDMMSGLKELVRLGVADPQALGVCGHSYGAYLTAYAIAKAPVFSGAVIVEAATIERVSGMANAAPGTDWAVLMRDLHGVRNPYDPVERARILEESPLLHVDQVRTPTLLLYGANSGAYLSGWSLFNALQRFGVPSELVVYDEGHVFQRPAAVVDSIERTKAWMDRWLRQQ